MIVHEVPARAHLAGNPSDRLGGAVLSCRVPGLAARVELVDADVIQIHGPSPGWPSATALADHGARLGHEGGDRLVSAAIAVLARNVGEPEGSTPFRITWDTTVPRSVGLSGSSALVIATMQAVLEHWGVRLPPTEVARLALATETDELGLTAGIADRMAQTHEGCVHTDMRHGDGSEAHAVATVIPVTPGIELAVAWNATLASPSDRYHRGLDKRSPAERAAIGARLAEAADAASEALMIGDAGGLADAADASVAGRFELSGVDPALVEATERLQRLGFGVNFAGSGGAFVLVPRSGELATLDLEPGWDLRIVRL